MKALQRNYLLLSKYVLQKHKKLLMQFFMLLLFFNSNAQKIGNYVANGSFEDNYVCLAGQNYALTNAKHWSGIDSLCPSGIYFAVCNSKVPVNVSGYQYPKTGNAYVLSIFYYPINSFAQIMYLKNRLKSNLQTGHNYCVKFYVNIEDICTYGSDGFGAYFGDDNLDTISYCNIPLSYLTPQVQNPRGNIITDTMNWVAVTGTFTANGTEKFLLLGNFLSNDSVSTLLINPTNLPVIWTDVLIDDVSCIEVNLPAYAGRDTTILIGDSVYIGREKDFAIDTGCVWYKLPGTTAIDTTSGMWVKPALGTHTFVVRQELECSGEKWDTVVVNVKLDDTGINKLKIENEELRIYPNPANEVLNVELLILNDETEMQIINILGELIKHSTLTTKYSQIDVSSLMNGIYFVVFTDQEKRSVTKKLIIVK